MDCEDTPSTHVDFLSAIHYTRLLNRPMHTAPLKSAKMLCSGTLPGIKYVDDVAADAHDAAAFSVRLVHLPAELMDEEMLLDQLLEYGGVDSLTACAPPVDISDGDGSELRQQHYLAIFATAEGAKAAVEAELEAAESALPAAQEPWARRSSSAPPALTIEAPALMPSPAMNDAVAPLSVAPSKRTLKRADTEKGLTTPGATPGGRRIISFGNMDDPASAAPERKGKFLLPGGRDPFAPGWDQNIEVPTSPVRL